MNNPSIPPSVAFVKLQATLSIVLGGLGTLFSLSVLALIYNIIAIGQSEPDQFVLSFVAAGIILLWIIPHIFITAAGIVLYRLPKPDTVKLLTIMTLITSVMGWNVFLLISSIITLMKLNEYRHDYHPNQQ